MLQCTMYSVHCTRYLYRVLYKVYNIHCIYNVHCRNMYFYSAYYTENGHTVLYIVHES